MKLRLLDLFSGIGGFSLGLERSGYFETVAFCEIEPFPRRVLAKHWPKVPCYHDIRELTGDRLVRDGIAVDAICGGFPCQDISFAGLGAGIDGARSGLWGEYARIIREVRPRYVIVENVSALLSRGLGRVLGDLAALGYDAEWNCIPASAVGAPHLRDRLWLVSYPQHPHANGTGPYRAEEHVNGNVELRNEQIGQPGSICEDVAYPASEHVNGSRFGPESTRRSKSANGSAVANPDGPRLEGWGVDRFGTGEWSVGTDRRSVPFGWLPEPDVGGGFDGFPTWLDRYVGRGLSYAESRRRTEVLRNLWSGNVSGALRRAAGGLERLSQAQVLFAFVREYEAGSDQARLLVAGSEASEDFLRGLRERSLVRSAPRRPGQGEQPAGEHPDALQSMSRLLACDGEAYWAGSGWEDATPRVSHGVKQRVDRLKGLGNAVVPQIPEIIGKAIGEYEADR